MSPPTQKSSIRVREESNVEDAIIRIGQEEGDHTEVGNVEIRRDPNYPIRVTMQYYKATSNGVVNDDVMSQIASQLAESRNFGTNVSSLVVENTGRPTEYLKVTYGGYPLPEWWMQFWNVHKDLFPNYTEQTARDKLFVNGRYCTANLNDIKDNLIDLLMF